MTLDDDVLVLLRQAVREQGRSFKQVLNAAVRAGLMSGGPAEPPYRLEPTKLGVRPGVDLTKALSLATALEDEEVSRRLELRK